MHDSDKPAAGPSEALPVAPPPDARVKELEDKVVRLQLGLEEAADTLRDSATAYHFFGKHVAAEAMELAERHCRALLGSVATAPTAPSGSLLGASDPAEGK